MWPFDRKPQRAVYECVVVSEATGKPDKILLYVNKNETGLTAGKYPWLKGVAISSAKPIGYHHEQALLGSGRNQYTGDWVGKAIGALVVNYQDFNKITELRF